MTTKISSDNIQDATLATIGSGPKITQVLVCDSSYNELDDTAVDTAGGYVKIVGSGFKTGATVTINRQQAVSVTFVSATELRAQVPAEVAGTYVVYVVNSDGGVALRVNGVTFSSLPAWTTDSTLPTSNSDALISIQLVAAQATQYTLAQGSTLPPDLTLSNSGLLSGTVSISTETTYNFQVVATDAELQDSPRSFSITITVGDPFFTSVTALVNTSGTNGAQNNTFIDSSTNNFTITRNGNTTQGTFSPYGENWSNFFPGSGEVSLRVPDSDAFWFDAQDFTLETWVFLSAKQSFNIFQQSNGSTGNILKWSWWFNNSTNNLILSGHNPATSPLTWATRAWTPVVGKWYHLAVSKQSNSFRMFVDGVELGTANTVTTALPQVTSELYISAFKDAPVSAPRELAGYFSNMRIVKGTAVYTSNFTPSTVPLQPVAGTSLLTCKDPNIVDDSPNQFTITRNGDVSVQKFGPFAGTTLPTPYYGAYFDGTGDYLTVPDNDALELGSSNFTIEAWVFPTATSTTNGIITKRVSNAVFGGYALFLDAGKLAFIADENTTSPWPILFTGGPVAPLNTWSHLAVTRNGSTWTTWFNGTLAQTGTASITINDQATSLAIGAISNGDTPFFGHISNARIVKGQALYTSNFTPSTVPLTTTSQGATAGNVSLLTCQSSQFIDNSTNNFAITAVGNSRPTTFAPFAVTYSLPQSYTPAVFGGSAYFDGTGDSLSTSSSYLPTSAGVAFTLEFWIYSTRAASSQSKLIESGNMEFNLDNANPGQIRFDLPRGVVNVLNSGAARVSPFTWNHIALTRTSGNAYSLYLNGVNVATGSSSTAINAVTSISPSTGIQGYVSGLRSLTGVVLYTSNFVPQNSPPAPVTNTTLLLSATNAGIYDASAMNVFETVGNAQVSTSVKKYGTSSMAFDGNGDSLDVKPLALPFFGQRGAYTIEAWIYPTNLSVAQYFYSQNTANFLQFAISSSGFLQVDRSGVGVVITSSSALTINTWQYVTLVSDGTNLRLYINGTQSGSTVSVGTQVNPSSAIIRIGAYQNSGGAPTFPFYGYIQDFRITQGIARYTGNFTPPTAALQTH